MVAAGDRAGEYHFHNQRPWKTWLYEETVLFLVALVSTFLAFVVFIILPLLLLYPIMMAVKPSSLMIIILLPCALLYGTTLIAVTFPKSRHPV